MVFIRWKKKEENHIEPMLDACTRSTNENPKHYLCLVNRFHFMAFMSDAMFTEYRHIYVYISAIRLMHCIFSLNDECRLRRRTKICKM